MDRSKTSRILSWLALALAASACGSSASSGSGGGVKSGAKDLLTFTSDDGVNFVVDEKDLQVNAVLVIVGDLDVQHVFITPKITVSPGATVSPASGQKEDFVSPRKYTVTAEDGTTKTYTVAVGQYAFPGKDQTGGGGIPTGDPSPQTPSIQLVTSVDSVIAGTWNFAWSDTLEIRQVDADTVATLQEVTPTTQTVTVKVNDTLRPPTTTTGKYGSSVTFKADHTLTGSDQRGDTSTGTWAFTDRGAGQVLRFQLSIDETTLIQGGPSVSGTAIFYVTGISAHALHLTRDPLVSSSSTTSFDILYQR